MKAFYNSLSDDGILVMQLGEAPEWFDPDETHSKFKNRAATISLLESVGFESIHAYEEVSDSCRSFHVRVRTRPHLQCHLFYVIVSLWLHGTVDFCCCL